MDKTPKIGFWLPPREDLGKTMDKDNPAHIDVRMVNVLMDYAKAQGMAIVEDVDFRRAVIRNHKVYIDDFCVSDLDHLFWMGVLDRDLDSYHLEILRVLELSTQLHNSYHFFHVATDKFTAFSTLHRYGVPVADLYLVNQDNVGALEPLFEQHSFLLKPRRSSFGIGIVKVDAFDQLRDIIEYHPRKSYYLERFYPNDMGEWTGVTVFNGTALYGFRKDSSKISGWKIYDKERIGGQTCYVPLNQEIEEIAVRVGEILGGNYYGLDFIKTEEGYKIVDINCYPGMYFDMMMELKLPIAELFFKSLPVEQKVA